MNLRAFNFELTISISFNKHKHQPDMTMTSAWRNCSANSNYSSGHLVLSRFESSTEIEIMSGRDARSLFESFIW